MIWTLNHENRNWNNNVFDVYEYWFINIEETSTFINKIHYNDVNFLTNEKLRRVNQFFRHTIYFDIIIKQRFDFDVVNKHIYHWINNNIYRTKKNNLNNNFFQMYKFDKIKLYWFNVHFFLFHDLHLNDRFLFFKHCFYFFVDDVTKHLSWKFRRNFK